MTRPFTTYNYQYPAQAGTTYIRYIPDHTIIALVLFRKSFALQSAVLSAPGLLSSEWSFPISGWMVSISFVRSEGGREGRQRQRDTNLSIESRRWLLRDFREKIGTWNNENKEISESLTKKVNLVSNIYIFTQLRYLMCRLVMMESGKSPKSIFHKIRADRVRSLKEQCFWLFNICLEGVGEILPDIRADIAGLWAGAGSQHHLSSDFHCNCHQHQPRPG